MKTLSVPGMHCPKCVERINKALGEDGIACEIDLAAKTVKVEESAAEKTVEILDDLGFDAQ